METSDWFNVWEKRNFPYKELLVGDTIYWLDTVNKTLTWKTEVIAIERFPYSDKKEIYEKHPYSESKAYFDLKKDKGYFLGYKVKVIERVDIVKPNYEFDRLGWERLDQENLKRWFNMSNLLDNVTIDDNLSKNEASLSEKIIELNTRMQFVSPERISKLMNTTIRKDTAFINLLKKAANYKCQYPNCGHQIKTKDNGYYIEVAHVAAVKKGGASVLGNLVILCPNHHKEFDYGNRKILIQSSAKLSGILNGNHFEIMFNYHVERNKS